MTDIDSESDQLLSRVRRQWSATPADAERVLRATSLAIEAAPATAAVSGKLVLTATSKWIAALLATAMGAGTVGYVAGYRAATHPERSRPAIAQPSAAAPLPVREPVPVPVPAQPLPLPQAPRPAQPLRPPNPHDPDFDPAPSLTAETRAMRRIERALRDENPALALRLLSQLERSPVPGQLLEERAAATALAHCAQAPDPERARGFDAQHPRSVYRTRVERACAAISGDAKESP